MTGITEFLTQDHRRCDGIFSIAEEKADQENWGDARSQTQVYIDNMERHIAMEELVLFPAFEERTGMSHGPTQVMREEHLQMKEFFTQLQQAAEDQQRETFLEIAETLLILMQQHNMKEEGMLYPMADEHLGDDTDQILADMEQVGG